MKVNDNSCSNLHSDDHKVFYVYSLFFLLNIYNLFRCPTYPPMPTYCHKNSVPGQCCPVVSCDVPGLGSITPYPQLVPTPAPTKVGMIPTPAPDVLSHLSIIVPNPKTNLTGGLPGGGYPVKPDQISGVTSKFHIEDMKSTTRPRWSWNFLHQENYIIVFNIKTCQKIT